MWFAMGLVALLILAISHWLFERRSHLASGGILPPGSMGLPFIGESIEFFLRSKSIDIPPFIKKRTKMYGSIFKTSLLGRPVVVSMDADFNRFILLQEGKMVELWYLDAVAKLLGQEASTEDCVKTNATGYIHKYIRSSVLTHFGPERLKDDLLPQLQAIADETLVSWMDKDCVDAKQGCTAMIFSLMSKQVFSYDAKKSDDKLAEDVQNLVGGFLSFPLNIPGTSFHRSLKSHKKIMEMIRREIDERLSSPDARKGDLLDHFISDMKNEAFLTSKFISYLIMVLLIAGFEAVSSAMTIAIKYLSENPDVVQKLMVN
ncbi:hypothetical protein NL676_036704 [Syzygium grande]|nr:hypothetical protein NL676_036704 [Syzygium grande]